MRRHEGKTLLALAALALLTVFGSYALGQRITAPGGSTQAVSSVFGRTGAIAAASGDYTATQITAGTFPSGVTWNGATVGVGFGGTGTPTFVAGLVRSPGGTAGLLTYAGTGACPASQFINQLDAAGAATCAAPAASGISVQNRQASTVDVVSSVTEDNLYSYNVPANLLGSTLSLVLELTGDSLYNNNVADTKRVRVYYGATVICDTTAVTDANGLSATRSGWGIKLTLSAANATNAQVVQGRIWQKAPGVAGTVTVMQRFGAAANGTDFCTHNSVAEDSTAIKTFKVTWQWSASSVNNSGRALNVRLKLE